MTGECTLLLRLSMVCMTYATDYGADLWESGPGEAEYKHIDILPPSAYKPATSGSDMKGERGKVIRQQLKRPPLVHQTY